MYEKVQMRVPLSPQILRQPAVSQSQLEARHKSHPLGMEDCTGHSLQVHDRPSLARIAPQADLRPQRLVSLPSQSASDNLAETLPEAVKVRSHSWMDMAVLELLRP